MAFKGVTQRWRKMRARNVFALNSFYLGGNQAGNKLSKALQATEVLGTVTMGTATQHIITATVTGAEMGNYVMSNVAADVGTMTAWGNVNTSNQVAVVLNNLTGDTAVIATGTNVKILVLKP